MVDIEGAWQGIRTRAGLHDVRIHDIRHSFASRALALGEGLPLVGKLLGHRRHRTTARYAHLARDSVRESAERIAVSIAADILKTAPSLLRASTADRSTARPPDATPHPVNN